MVILALRAAPAFGQAGTYHWFKFRKDAVTSLYQDEIAKGSIAAVTWTAAAQPHEVGCNGKDGELHIGIFNTGLEDPSNAPSVTESHPEEWGLVAELPDAAAGNGPSTLDTNKTKKVTFTGYLRVWNEGHDHGKIFPSNPHHVLELNPAWKLVAGNDSFDDASLIRPMTGFHGYGASKFRPLLQSITDGNWPLAYQDDTYLCVKLRQEDNFYQLPTIAQETHQATGGHTATVDVYSDSAYQHRRYQHLRCITVNGSAYDDKWHKNHKDFLLGFFSVNLKKCLDESTGPHTKTDAVTIADALEFFVFGTATGQAVASCP